MDGLMYFFIPIFLVWSMSMIVYLLAVFLLLGGTTSAICAYFNKESRKKYLSFSAASWAIMTGVYLIYQLKSYWGILRGHWGMVFSNTIVFAFSIVLICLILSALINLICAVLREEQRKGHLLLAGTSVALLLAGTIIVFIMEHTLLEQGRFLDVFWELYY